MLVICVCAGFKGLGHDLGSKGWRWWDLTGSFEVVERLVFPLVLFKSVPTSSCQAIIGRKSHWNGRCPF